jgi:hypothetical protein
LAGKLLQQLLQQLAVSPVDSTAGWFQQLAYSLVETWWKTAWYTAGKLLGNSPKNPLGNQLEK